MLTLQFIPYEQIENLSSAKRIQRILNIVKQDKIVLLQGRLKKEEEKDLIEITMEEISDKFKGIELSVIYPEQKKEDSFLNKMKHGFMGIVLGDRQGFTIIGPASVVKEIKKDPKNIMLYTKNGKTRKKGKK